MAEDDPTRARKPAPSAAALKAALGSEGSSKTKIRVRSVSRRLSIEGSDARMDSLPSLPPPPVPTESLAAAAEDKPKRVSHRRNKSIGAAEASSGKVRKKKRRPLGASLKSELALLRSTVASDNQELVAHMEALLAQLEDKEPAALNAVKKSGASAPASSITISPAANSGALSASGKDALVRLCRQWQHRREALKSPEARAVRDRVRVWDAFIASEKKYFLTLLTLVQKCLRPLMASSPLITEDTLVEVFGSLPEIKDQSKALLSKLRASTGAAPWIPSTSLGSLFLNDVLPFVSKSYVLYVVEFPKRIAALARLVRKVPEARTVLDRGFSDGSTTTQSLAEMLLVPMHRMSAYEWTLQELLRLTPTDHVCRDDMQKAVMGISQLNLMLVMQKKQASRAQMLADSADIHNHLVTSQASPADQLSATLGAALDGRQFVRDGPVYVVEAGGAAEKRHLYLFNDCLAVGSLRPAGIVFDDNLLLRTCQLTDCDEAEANKFVFDIAGTAEGLLSSTKKTMRIGCNTAEEKKSWMNDINTAINSVNSDKQLAIATGNVSLTSLDLDKVAANMRHPASGVPVKTRKRRLQVFNEAFTGTEATDWLARNYSLPRRAAVELGLKLMLKHYFHHVAYDPIFEDKPELYVFQELGEGLSKLPDGLNYAELVKKMFHPQQGIQLGSKKGRFGVGKRKNVFSGADAVDWLHKNLKVQRHVAISIGEHLLALSSYFTALTGDVFADDKDKLYCIKSGTMEDLSFPTERVLKALRELKGSPLYKGSSEDLDYVIKMLTSGGNMYASNLMSILDQDANLDQDTKKFVLSYAGDSASSVKKKMQERTFVALSTALVVSESDASSRSPLINALVAKVGEWDYPVFQLDEESNHTPLYAMAYAMFVAHDLINKFHIEERKLERFLRAMNEGYRKNHYHNAIHASDVTQTVNFFLRTGPMVAGTLTDAELFGVVLAAVIHDFDHPGVNNAFMINSKSDIAIRYNDISVLENHHLAASFAIMLQEDCNIFSNCTDEVYKEVRSTTIHCVLATDFGKHFDLLGQFKGKIASGGLDFEKSDDRRLVLQLALKAADISHTSKSLETHRRWTESITEEFYSQGDAERTKNLPLSPFMDRSTGNLPKSQIGFIGFLVMPLYEAWVDVFEESAPALEGVQRNLAYWKEQSEKT